MQVVRASHKNNHGIRESNSDVGNALATSHHALPLKTPARTAAFNNTVLRTNLKENALRTTATLGKNAHDSAAGLKHHVFYPNTPGLKQAHLGTGRLLLKDNAAAGFTFATNTSVMPPLLDLTNKTPFTTRFPHDSPGDAKPTPLKMPFLAPSSPIVSGLDASPETIIRPSRSRFSLRSPRPSSQIKLGQRSNDSSSFKTPDPLGRRNHWDISHGDISISVTGPDVEVESISECDDEIEYMPPPVAELPYDPGFPMPDYHELGTELWKLGNVLDLNTLLPYDPPAHLQKFEFESDNVVADAIASLTLSLEALREGEDDDDDPFLAVSKGNHAQLQEASSVSRTAKATTAPSVLVRMQTTGVATRSSSRLRNDTKAGVTPGPSASIPRTRPDPTSGSRSDASNAKILSVPRPVRSTSLNVATHLHPSGGRTRSAPALKPQQTVPARLVPPSRTVRTRAQGAMAAPEPASTSGSASVRKHTASSTPTKAIPIRRPNSRTLPPAGRRSHAMPVAIAKSRDLPANKEFEDRLEEVVRELMVPQTAYLELLA